MSSLNIRKLANVFIPRATPSALMPTAAFWAIDRFKRKQGGLWVGGTVLVSQSGVSFLPNRLNRAFHEGLEPINVLANDIRAVKHEFGWFTGIVVVEHVHGEFRFRCYGAKQLAATMAASFNVPQQPQVLQQQGKSPGQKCPEGEGLYPECLFVVTVSGSEIVNQRPDGTVERVSIHDLEEVTIVTNDSGPTGVDLWWLLVGSKPDAGCAFPGGATGEAKVLEFVQQLPGFNNQAFIEAMGCASNARFVCWRAAA